MNLTRKLMKLLQKQTWKKSSFNELEKKIDEIALKADLKNFYNWCIYILRKYAGLLKNLKVQMK